MQERFSRNRLLLGENSAKRLKSCHAAVFGLGGVGSYAAEALCRAGVGSLTLIDGDCVAPSNINRQLCALSSTVGLMKTEVVKARLADINPEAQIHIISDFYRPDCREAFFADYDIIIDAIDPVREKVDLIAQAHLRGIEILSSMGTGNRLDPTRLEFTDIYSTEGCPLARAVRSGLRKAGISSHRVLFSRETPVVSSLPGGRVIPSVSWVPGCAGLMLAGEAVRIMLKMPSVD